MAKSPLKITGGAKLHADVQAVFEKQGSAGVQASLGRLLNLAKTGAEYAVVTYAATSAPVFATFFKGQPVSEEDFIRLTLDSLKRSNLPIEEDLLLIDLQELREKDPEKYNAWKESGFKATGWQAGVIGKVNKQLGGEEDLYLKTRSRAEDAGRLMSLASRTSTDDLDMWRMAALEFVETNSLQMSAKGTGLKLWLEVIDEQLILQSRISYDEFNKTLRFFQGKANPEPFKIEERIVASDYAVKHEINTPDIHMGHTDADTTQRLRMDKKILLEARALAEGNVELIAIYDKAIHFVDLIINKQVAIDKMFISYEGISRAKGDLNAQFQKLLELSAALGANEVLIVNEISGKITTKTTTVSMNLSARVFNPEPGATNSWKGAKSGALTRLWESFLKNMAESEDLVTKVLSSPNSSSYMTVMLLKNLAKIFDEKELEAYIKNPKRKVSSKRIQLKTRKTVLASDAVTKRLKQNEDRIAKARRNLKNAPVKGRAKLLKGTKSIRVSKQPIYDRRTVDLLNADIKRYVIQQMVKPSLENRSGRFASSVRITEVTMDNVIKYIYRKSPYQVFSMSEGKSPWANPQRDPATIIDKAIKKLAYDKLGLVYRTELTG